MKQKNDLLQPATKRDLVELEERLEKKFDKKFATKIDLAVQLENLYTRMDDNARKYRDQILTKFDSIVGEQQDNRQELLITNHHSSRSGITT